MLVFYLFRINLHRPGPTLYRESRGDWVGELIRQQPVAESGEQQRFRIGSIAALGDQGLLLSMDSPSPAYAIYDSAYGLLSLAPPRPTPAKARDMARRMQALLNARARMHGDARIGIDAVIDPEDFIDHIMDAFAVTEFTVRCGEPNALDTGNGPFVPMQAMLGPTGGESVRTSILGEDLDREVLEKLTRTAAGKGHEVRIRLQEARGQRPVSRRMRGHAIDFLVRQEDIPGQADTVLDMARQIFQHIQGEDG